MKKWSAAIFLTAVLGVFVGSGYACGVSTGLFKTDEDPGVSEATITLLNENTEAGTVQGGCKITVGESVTLTAVAKPGWKFVGWFAEGSDFPVSTKATYTFVAAKDVLYKARFVEDVPEVETYLVTVSPESDAMGSVSGGGEFVQGTSATVKAKAYVGYTFDGWYEGTQRVSTDAEYTFAVTKATTLVAKWTLNEYTITATAQNADAGDVTKAGGTYDHGDTVTVEATTKEGYIFLGWHDGNNIVSTAEEYTFTATENKSLEARWAIKTYSVTVNKNIGEAGTVAGANTYNHGAMVTLTATTNSGYKFSGWFDGARCLSTSDEYSFEASKSMSITAKWEASNDEYTVTVERNIEDAGIVDGAGTYEEGETITLEAKTAIGYVFEGWYDENGSFITSDVVYEFTLTQNVIVEAKWKIATFTVTTQKSHDAAGSITETAEYDYNATATLTATTNHGYTFLGWFDENGAELTTSDTYTYVVAENRTFTAKWSVNQYNIEIEKSHGTAGEVTGAGTYDYNSKVTLTATELPGFAFLGWYNKANDTLISDQKEYEYTVENDIQIVAKWEVTGYNVTIQKSNDAAGSVEGGGVVTKGQSTTLVATSNKGYKFVGWYNGAILVSSDAEFNYTPEANITLTATWEIDYEYVEWDESKVGATTGHVASFSTELLQRTSVPIVYVDYDGTAIRCFPWITATTKEGSPVDVPVGSRGTKFLPEHPTQHKIEYYIELDGIHKICETIVSVSDTSGPKFNLPASADGMLVYLNKEVELPNSTATDPSGVNGGTQISVTFGGQPVAVSNGKFTPTQFGDYTVTYSATDTVGNNTTISFRITCAPMVEICNFDDENSALAYGYTNTTSTYADYTTETRYGTEGNSMHFKGVGVGANDFIKVVAFPMFYDLSGFDEIAVTVWSDQDLSGGSAGAYLLNNVANSELPYDLKAGENLLRFTKDQFWREYPGGQIISNGDGYNVSSDEAQKVASAQKYRTENCVWLQFRAPVGCNIYIDNMVGIFDASNGDDKPVVDLGAGPALAKTYYKPGGVQTYYDGNYGNIPGYAGETLQTIIDRSVHAYDDAVAGVTIHYTVKKGGVTVTNLNAACVAGETYTIEAYAKDSSGKVSTTKSGTIVIRNKPIEHKLTEEEETTRTRTLNFASNTKVVEAPNAKVDVKFNKAGRVRITTQNVLDTVKADLLLGGKVLTADDINKMQYVNIRLCTYNANAEIRIGNQSFLLKQGINNVAFDKSLLLDPSVYDMTTGKMTFQIYSPLDNEFEIIIDSIKAVYASAADRPEGTDIPSLPAPKTINIDGKTGIVTWEAVEGATGYEYTVDGAKFTVAANVLTTPTALTDGQTFTVRALADGVNNVASDFTTVRTFYAGYDVVNEGRETVTVEMNGTKSVNKDAAYIKEGDTSIKVAAPGWTHFNMYLAINDVPIDLNKYESITINVYSTAAGGYMMYQNDGNTKIPGTDFVQGWNEFTISTSDLANYYVSSGATKGWMTLYLTAAGDLYFDKVVALLGDNLTKLTTPTVTINADGLASWTAIPNATKYLYKINGGAEQEASGLSVQLNEGDTIQVKAVGDNVTYRDSSYSAVVEYSVLPENEFALNVCESADTAMGVTLTSDLKTFGRYSFYVQTPADTFFTLTKAGVPVTRADIEGFDSISFDVYATELLGVYLANGTQVVDIRDNYNTWQTITIDRATLLAAIDATASNSIPQLQADGKFYLYFGAPNAYIDNFVYTPATDTPSVSGDTLLNSCDTADGFWSALGVSVNTNSAYVAQGSASACVPVAGWAPININWGTANITAYDSVKMTIWSDSAVKLLAGDINYNNDPNCILAELAVGRNDIEIPVSKLVAYNLTAQICAPYLSGACTLYFDNIVGVKGDASSTTTVLNNASAAFTAEAYNASSSMSTASDPVGAGYVKAVSNAAWSAIYIPLKENGAFQTTAQLQEKYSSITLRIYVATNSNVNISSKNIIPASAMGDWVEVTISTAELTDVSSMNGLANYSDVAGLMIWFPESGSVIYIDDIIGTKK